jgi:hypothetical protein
MKILLTIKKSLSISMLVLAHTPKRDATRPISQNDVSGSKNIMNFCDSCFAIGKSYTQDDVRYIKQIKERNTAKVYGPENIISYQLVKCNSFLQFEFLAFGEEQEHLLAKSQTDTESRNLNVLELHNQGKNNCEIGRLLTISEGTVRFILSKNK